MSISNEEVIPWREDVKLDWSQFQATPRPGLSTVALTASGISFEFSVKETKTMVIDFTAKVTAYFYPKKSWYVEEQSNDYILAHEQLHFDITELYARKFRKEIAQLQVNKNIKSQLRALQIKINKELAITQNRYDKESDNSINREFQLTWNDFIKSELNKLVTYKLKD